MYANYLTALYASFKNLTITHQNQYFSQRPTLKLDFNELITAFNQRVGVV